MLRVWVIIVSLFLHITAAAEILKSVQTITDPYPGFVGIFRLLQSPDGEMVVTWASPIDRPASALTFSRDPESGLLLAEDFVPTESFIAPMAISPDSRQLYVREGLNAQVRVFERIADTAEWTPLPELDLDQTGLVPNLEFTAVGFLRISPDGRFAHALATEPCCAAEDPVLGLIAFSRDPSTGALTKTDLILDETIGFKRGDFIVQDIAYTPDGRMLLVSARDIDDEDFFKLQKILAFSLDSESGRPTFQRIISQEVFTDTRDVESFSFEISKGGRHLYASFWRASAFERQSESPEIAIFSLDSTAGDLQYLDTFQLPPNGDLRRNFGEPYFTIGMGDDKLYYDADREVRVLNRDDASGLLSVSDDRLVVPNRIFTDFPGGFPGSENSLISASIDGKHLYTTPTDVGGSVDGFPIEDALSAVNLDAEGDLAGIGIEPNMTLLEEGEATGIEDADAIALSATGNRLYVISRKTGVITVFDRDPLAGLLQWQQSFRFSLSEGDAVTDEEPIPQLEMHPSDRGLLYLDGWGGLLGLDLNESGEVISSESVALNRPASSMVISPDRQFVYFKALDVDEYDAYRFTSDGQIQHLGPAFPVNGQGLHALRFSTTRPVAYVARDNALLTVDYDEGTGFLSIRSNTGDLGETVWDIVLSPDDDRLFASAENGALLIFSLSAETGVPTLLNQVSDANIFSRPRLKLSPDGDYLVVTSVDLPASSDRTANYSRIVLFFDSSNDQLLRVDVSTLPDEWRVSPNFSEDGLFLYQTEEDIGVYAFNRADFSQTDIFVNENAGQVIIDLEALFPVMGPQQIRFAISGTAEQGDDFLIGSESVLFTGGSQSAQLVVDLVDDQFAEDAESVILTMVNSTAGLVTGFRSQIQINIEDDDSGVEAALDIPGTNEVLGIILAPVGLAEDEVGCRISAGSGAIPVPSVPVSPPPALQFIQNVLVALSLDDCALGESVQVSVEYPGDLPENGQYWKFGATPDDPTPHWYQLPATISGDTVSFVLTDGGSGDDDLTANGQISDPGGIAIQAISGVPVEVPTLNSRMLWLLAAMMLLMGGASIRRRLDW